MAEVATFEAWAASLPRLSYYAILRVPTTATTAQIKEAFHAMALRCHPDKYSEEPPEVGKAASEVFKRIAEAYSILSRPLLRERYDEQLKTRGGGLRLDPKTASAPKPKPALPAQRTLEMIARSPDAKKHAIKADRFLTAGNLEGARLALVNACQQEPHNEELAERLTLIYEAMALEPL